MSDQSTSSTLTGTNSSTLDDSSRTHHFRAVEEPDGTWLVSDCPTSVYGNGRSLLEAFCDYWSALGFTAALIESAPASKRLQREAVAIRRLLGRAT